MGNKNCRTAAHYVDLQTVLGDIPVENQMYIIEPIVAEIQSYLDFEETAWYWRNELSIYLHEFSISSSFRPSVADIQNAGCAMWTVLIHKPCRLIFNLFHCADDYTVTYNLGTTSKRVCSTVWESGECEKVIVLVQQPKNCILQIYVCPSTTTKHTLFPRQLSRNDRIEFEIKEIVKIKQKKPSFKLICFDFVEDTDAMIEALSKKNIYLSK